MKNIFEMDKKFSKIAIAEYFKQEKTFRKTAHGFGAWLLLCNQVVDGKKLKPIPFTEGNLSTVLHDPRIDVYVNGHFMDVNQAFDTFWMGLDQFDRDMWERAHIVTCIHDVMWCAKMVLEAEGYCFKEHQNKTLEEMSRMAIEDGALAAGKYLHYLRYKASENDVLWFYHKGFWALPEKWLAIWETAEKAKTEAEIMLLARQSIQFAAGFQQGEIDSMSFDDMLDFSEAEVREAYPFMLYLDEKRTDIVWQPDPYFEGLGGLSSR